MTQILQGGLCVAFAVGIIVLAPRLQADERTTAVVVSKNLDAVTHGVLLEQAFIRQSVRIADHVNAVFVEGARGGTVVGLVNHHQAPAHVVVLRLSEATRVIGTEPRTVGVPLVLVLAQGAQGNFVQVVGDRACAPPATRHTGQAQHNDGALRQATNRTGMANRILNKLVRSNRQGKGYHHGQYAQQWSVEPDGPAEEHEYRPVPEVQGIGDAAHVDQRRVTQQRMEATQVLVTVQAVNHSHGAGYGRQRTGKREMGRGRERQATQQDRQGQCSNDPTPRCWRFSFNHWLLLGQLEQQHTRGQLPKAAWGQEVGFGRTDCALPAGEDHRGDSGHREQGNGQHAPLTATEPGQEHERKDQVELFFDRQ